MRVAMGAGAAPRKLRERGGEKGAGPPAGADWPLGSALRAPGTATPAAAAVSPTSPHRLAAAAAVGREDKGINFKLGRGGRGAAWMPPSLGADSQPAAARGARGAAAPLPPPPAMVRVGRGARPGP